MILLIGVMLNIPSYGSTESEVKIIGRLVKVDAASGIIYVMHDSRIVKFKASREICNKFDIKTKPLVEIEYSKCGEKGFCIESIVIISGGNDKEDSRDLNSESTAKSKN